ncbi:hypothetical protein TcasGA2_TC033207 [Tribolium castaneum]|uniref:Uncharacterized protein n=1 Tax=Tribolium castaneum TaxID=7070 RepID=A0A139WHM3_TRICA|nr:hypothetical protein TcasGA2_TC033207 [Tribolium castaneum]
MASLITVRLSKGDSPSLGFRLQGGKDFGTPLVIQKLHLDAQASFRSIASLLYTSEMRHLPSNRHFGDDPSFGVKLPNRGSCVLLVSVAKNSKLEQSLALCGRSVPLAKLANG